MIILIYLEAEYEPKAINMMTNEYYDLISAGHTCLPNKNACYYVKVLTKNLRLKNIWDRENYQLGKVGDYMLINVWNAKDCFIVRRMQYEKEYEKVFE